MMEPERPRKKQKTDVPVSAPVTEGLPDDMKELLEEKNEDVVKMAMDKKFRRTTLGQTLWKTLELMIIRKQVPESLADKILIMFDRCMTNAMTTRVTGNVLFKSEKLMWYKYVAGTWTFALKNAEFREYNCLVNVPKVKIVAHDDGTSKSRIHKDEDEVFTIVSQQKRNL